MNSKPSPITLSSTQGQTLSIAGGNYRVLVSAKETDGEFATIEMLVPPGGGPPPHSHANFTETFYVVEGEVEFRSEAGAYVAKKGAYVTITKGGIAHAFKNKTQNLAKLLCTVAPAGLEEVFTAIGKPVKAGEFLPPAPPDPEVMKTLASLNEKFGQQFYPPDFLDNVG